MSTDDYTKYLEDMEAMFERLEEAQDRAMLARWHRTCPRMPERVMRA